MCDDQQYQTNPPSYWKPINFKTVDVLFIAAAGLQNDGTFGLFGEGTQNPLSTRFKYVVDTARAQNSSIKIIVCQFMGSAPTIWGYDLTELNNRQQKDPQAITKYVNSVKAFLDHWNLDGYDVDYETTNKVSNINDILSKIHGSFQGASRPLVVTLTTDNLEFINATTVTVVDYLCIMEYGAGYSRSPSEFQQIGWPMSRIVYGVCGEIPDSSHTVAEAVSSSNTNKLAGIFNWRLASGDANAQASEADWQQQIHSAVHPPHT